MKGDEKKVRAEMKRRLKEKRKRREENVEEEEQKESYVRKRKPLINRKKKGDKKKQRAISISQASLEAGSDVESREEKQEHLRHHYSLRPMCNRVPERLKDYNCD